MMTYIQLGSHPVVLGVISWFAVHASARRLSRMTQLACLSTPQPALVCQLYPRRDQALKLPFKMALD
jgi:hypothetical protein